MVGLLNYNLVKFFVLSLSLLIFLATTASGNSNNNNWIEGDLKVYRTEFVDGVAGEYGCSRTMLPYEIDGERDLKRTCIEDAGSFRFGFYVKDNGSFQHVVGFGIDRKLYKLEITGCEYEGRCTYVKSKDTLIYNNEYLIAYRNFTSRLSRQINYINGSVYYVAKLSSYDYIFTSKGGNFSTSIGASAVSSNGDWLVRVHDYSSKDPKIADCKLLKKAYT